MPKLKNKILCVILGGGGHAKVVVDCLVTSGVATPFCILDLNPKLWGQELLGIPIEGGEDLIPKVKAKGVTHFVSGVGGIKDNRPRKGVFELGISHGLKPLTVIHPQAVCSKWATAGEGTVLFAGAVINPGVKIGDNVIVNTGVIVDHDCIVGDHVHLATGVKLSGGVKVCEGAHIGTGASVKQGVTIGKWAIVGAGSVVVKDVLPKTIVKGVPAREDYASNQHV